MLTKIQSLFAAEPSKRDERLDIIKGICILGVVGIHFGGSFVGRAEVRWSPVFFTALYWNQIFTFAVPVFLFIAGYIVGKKKSSTPLVFCYKRFMGLMPKYFLACVAWWYFFPKAAFITDLTWEHTFNNYFFRFFYRGIQGTYFFVTAILQLSLLTPMVCWLVRSARKCFHRYTLFVFAVFFLIIHAFLGGFAYFDNKPHLGQFCFNYYYLCLPFSPFWLFYYFLGLYAEDIVGAVGRKTGYILPFVICAIGAIGVQTYNLLRLSNKEIAGEAFNLINIDLAYSRPSMMIYSLFVVGCVALFLVGTPKGFPFVFGFFKYFGRHSYEIYLWHLMLMQYIGWGTPWSGFPNIITLCQKYPVLIAVECLVVCVIISSASYALQRLRQLHHKLMRYPQDRVLTKGFVNN